MNIESKTLQIIASLSWEENITLEDTLASLGIDSIVLIEIIIALEDWFEIQFNSSDLDPFELVTVADVIDLVKRTVANERKC